MKIAALLALIVASQATQDLATYSNPALGLTLSHPKTWQVTTNKKNETKALIPIEGSKASALLEIYPVPFDAETSIWQMSQVAMNKQLRHEVVRQWDEQIMEAPMLLTKTSYSDKQGAHVQLTGLVYSKTPRKLMFKLTASPEDYDKAEFDWRSALQTIRTYDNSTLRPDDGKGRGVPAKGQKSPMPPQVTQPVKVTVLDGNKGPKKTEKAPVVVKMHAGGKDVQLHMPNGWSAATEESGVFLLSNPEVSTKVTVTVSSVLDSDPPGRALFKASSVSLNDFVKVEKREEPEPAANHAGATVARVWRTGKGAGGDLYTCEGAGVLGDFYFLATYRCQDSSKIGAERKVIDALLDAMSVELAP